jgi:hypothetical protein
MKKRALFVKANGEVAPCSEFAYTHNSFVNLHFKKVNEVVFGGLQEGKHRGDMGKGGISKFNPLPISS